MTDHGVAGELTGRDRTPSRRSRRPSALSQAEVLSLCDRHLNEAGRRDHVFAWLRPPGGAADSWLPVDAYYPRHRLVVLYRPTARAHDQIYRELIPEHGLRLLALSPDELGSTAAGAERALAALLARLAPPAPPVADETVTSADGLRRSTTPADSASAPPRRHASPAAEVEPPRRRRASPLSPPAPPPPSAAQRAERFLAARATRQTRRPGSASTAPSPMVGVVVGFTLFLVLLVAALYIASNAG